MRQKGFSEMRKDEFLIGDVSELSGISRDTLRFYEKKGIISAKKKENGYRYYSYDDIFKLSNILYSRKMNICLEDISELWHSESSYRSMAAVAARMIRKEQEDIRVHQQTLARLQMTLDECIKIDQSLDRISLKEFPVSHVIRSCASSQETLQEWFRLSATQDGMDMAYTYDQFRFDGRSVEFENSHLLFDEQAKELLDVDLDLSQFPQAPWKQCVYSMVESERCAPPVDTVQRMVRWAKEHGVEAGDQVISSMRLQTGRSGKTIYYLKIYIPVSAR